MTLFGFRLKPRRAAIGAAAIALSLGAFAWLLLTSPESSAPSAGPESDLSLNPPPVFHGIPLHLGRKRDEIQALDEPVFVRAVHPSLPLKDDDWILGLHWGGISKAYPMWILTRQEIVNDRFGSEPVCVTYCPLSASPMAFLARAGGRRLRFGNEGSLYECNLVMYDRTTSSLWYQLRGECLGGPFAGTRLESLPIHRARWRDWRERYPDSIVLIGDRRMGRFFQTSDAGTTLSEEHHEPAAPVSVQDPRLDLMTVVAGFRDEGGTMCFPLEPLQNGDASILHVGEGYRLVREKGLWRLFNSQGTEHPLTEAYWFTWHAAYPQGTLLTRLHPPDAAGGEGD